MAQGDDRYDSYPEANGYADGGYPITDGGGGNVREEPHNIEAEKSVLAACLLSDEAMEDIAVKLQPDSFYRPAHRMIFEAMLDLYTRHVP